MTTCVDIILEEKMIIILRDLCHCCKVSRLKPTLKDQSVVLWPLPLVKCLNVDLDQLLLLCVLFLLLVLLLDLGHLGRFEKLFDIEQVLFNHCISLTLLVHLLEVNWCALVH